MAAEAARTYGRAMTQIRIAAGLMAFGALVWVVGAMAPWSSIGDRDYSGGTGSELAWITAVLVVVIAAASGLAGRGVASVVRWALLPVAAIGMLVTVAILINTATSTADDVAQYVDGPLRTRELAWGIWVSLVGAIIATVAGILAVLAPSPRRESAAIPS